jgi:predicted PurR-regulated permease PerM
MPAAPDKTPAPNETATWALLGAAAVVVLIAGLKAAADLVVPFLLAMFVTIIAAPPMRWLERHGVPKILALLLVLSVVVMAALALGGIIAVSMDTFTENLPAYQARLRQILESLLGALHRVGIDAPKLDVVLQEHIDPGAAMRLAARSFEGLRETLTNSFLILLTVVFMLLEAGTLPVKLRAIARNPERTLPLLHAIGTNINQYLGIKTITSLLTGVSAAGWVALVGVDFPVLWGTVAFLLNYIPNIGSVIAAIPPVLLGLIQYDLGTALWVALGYLVINSIIGSFLEPRVMGRGLGLSPLVVFVSMVFWGWVLGPVGMFLSVPLTNAATIALAAHESTRWVAVLLGPAPESMEPLPAAPPATGVSPRERDCA